jgi:Holliday junction resolvasome RuvABC endonuclease subunit
VNRVVGLDPSLSAFGVAAVEGGRVVNAASLTSGRETGHARVEGLIERVANWTRGAVLVVIEGPSYGSTGGKPHERAGLWWSITQELWRDGVGYAVVSPRTRAKYATGNGNAGKADVLAAASVRFDLGQITDDNVADALTLAAMGARQLLEPIDRLDSDDPLTPKRQAALDAVVWPAVAVLA